MNIIKNPEDQNGGKLLINSSLEQYNTLNLNRIHNSSKQLFKNDENTLIN